MVITPRDTHHQIWSLYHMTHNTIYCYYITWQKSPNMVITPRDIPVMFQIQKRRENPVMTVISSDTGTLTFVAASNTVHRIVFDTAPVVRECDENFLCDGGREKV